MGLAADGAIPERQIAPVRRQLQRRRHLGDRRPRRTRSYRRSSTNPLPGATVGSYANAISMPDPRHVLVSIGRDNAIAVYKYNSLFGRPFGRARVEPAGLGPSRGRNGGGQAGLRARPRTEPLQYDGPAADRLVPRPGAARSRARERRSSSPTTGASATAARRRRSARAWKPRLLRSASRATTPTTTPAP